MLRWISLSILSFLDLVSTYRRLMERRSKAPSRNRSPNSEPINEPTRKVTKGRGKVDWRIIVIISDWMKSPPAGDKPERVGTYESMISIPIAMEIAERKPRSAFPASAVSAPPMTQIVKASK